MFSTRKICPIIWAVACFAILPLSDARASDDAPTISYVNGHYPNAPGDYPTYNIYSMKIDGTDKKTLTSDGDSITGGWSPDGKQIAYTHRLPTRMVLNGQKVGRSHRLADLWVMNRDGSNKHELLHLEGVLNGPEWSPDGKTITFNYIPQEELNEPTLHHQSPYSIYCVNADGAGELKLLKKYSPHGRFSPDGKMEAFVVLSSDRLTVHVADADGSNDHPLVDPSTYPTAEGPVWSPDGKRIAFAAMTGHADPEKGFVSEQGIFTANPDGSDVRKIVGDPKWFCTQPSWSPKGDQIAYSCLAVPGCSGFVNRGNSKTPPPPCVREMFLISLAEPDAKPIDLGEGMAPEFSPR